MNTNCISVECITVASHYHIYQYYYYYTIIIITTIIIIIINLIITETDIPALESIGEFGWCSMVVQLAGEK